MFGVVVVRVLCAPPQRTRSYLTVCRFPLQTRYPVYRPVLTTSPATRRLQDDPFTVVLIDPLRYFTSCNRRAVVTLHVVRPSRSV